MQLDNKAAIAILIAIEMSVEFIANMLEHTFSRLPWSSWWLTAQRYHVPDIAICVVMMAMIIVAIALLEPKTFQDFAKSFWQKCLVFLAVVKHKRLKKNRQ